MLPFYHLRGDDSASAPSLTIGSGLAGAHTGVRLFDAFHEGFLECSITTPVGVGLLGPCSHPATIAPALRSL